MIRLERLRFAYNGSGDVLRLDQFVLEPESNILVVGPSGCGKTTLLHLIAGLLLPTGGSVVVDGQDLSALSPPARDRFRGRHIGIVLQQFHLLPTLTAMQNLLVAQSIAGKKWGSIYIPRIGQEVIVDFLEGDPDQPIIVGSVYNAQEMPPYKLPDEKTKTVMLKSNSSKAGAGCPTDS